MQTELIELTRKMRQAQKAYFASRTNRRLQESMRLEKLLDAELAKYPVMPVKEAEQWKLL